MAGVAAPPPPPPSNACPKCGTAAPVGARFCNACGASLSGPGAAAAPGVTPSGPPATSAPPVDIRERVDQDRGILKRLQLLIPGFRGYREGEDIRAADSLLRLQVADKVKAARVTLENSRAALTNAKQFSALNDLAPLIADLMQLEAQIRHAEQGYTGISPAVRANQGQLDRIYEYDYGFAQAADQLNQTVEGLPAAAMGAGGNPSSVPQIVATARGQVAQLDSAFKARLQSVEGVRVP